MNSPGHKVVDLNQPGLPSAFGNTASLANAQRIRNLEFGGHSATSIVVFIDVSHDSSTGERLYVSLEAACQVATKKASKGSTLPLIPEKEVKQLPQKMLLVAKLPYTSARYDDFTMVDELSVGPNQVLLSSHSALLSPMGNHPAHLFGNISVIVNCHQKQADAPKYHYKAHNILYHEIHDLVESGDDCIKVFLEINEAIWKGVQTGNVFIHCLAGVHRAAAVCVAHFIWRYYALGHTHLPNDIPTIYESLALRRQGVAGLGYEEMIIDFKKYLEQPKKL